MSIQYMVLGFEHITFEHESPPITSRQGLLTTSYYYPVLHDGCVYHRGFVAIIH